MLKHAYASEFKVFPFFPMLILITDQILFSRLKQDYTKNIKTLGSTRVGLDPDNVTEGSELANLVGMCYVSVILLFVYILILF